MSKPLQQFGLRVISGNDRSVIGFLVRAGMAMVEPFYATAMRIRNWCFDRGIKPVVDLGRPTVSIGNITTGGTGKTPVVLWLAQALRERGYHPAVLLRGYGATTPGESDERQLLDNALNQAGSEVLRRGGSGGDPSGSSEYLRDRLGGEGLLPIPVRANPSRVASARRLLVEDPCIDVFILDDAFQHRTARRDFDLVVISATEPFGFGHMLPRGLLREPLAGLRRATAFLITRSSQADCSAILQTLSRINPAAPVFRSDHVHSSVWIAGTDQRVPIEKMSGEKVFLFAGIGDPESFAVQIANAGCRLGGHRWFADHHPYTSDDLSDVIATARRAGATCLLTTQKDWVKIAAVYPAASELKIGVVELSIAFADGDGQLLLARLVEQLRVKMR